MKMETAVIITKGACYMIIGIFTPWSAALAQWANSGEWPARIIWVAIILPASMLGGAGSLLAFLSGSWANYKSARAESFPDAPEKITPPKDQTP